MKIAVVILHFGPVERTKLCLTKLKNKIAGHSLILVNNTKEDITPLTKIIQETQLINNGTNVGFARGVNQGIKLALVDEQITHILLMNNDLEFASGTIAELLTTFRKHERVGIVSPILHHERGYDWGGRYNRWTAMVRHTNWQNKPKTVLSVDHVAGAAMLIPRGVINDVGLFNERYFLYFEDLDYCLRVKDLGYSIRINPAVVAEHKTSSGSGLFRRTLYQWRSHLVFVLLHLPYPALPTALLYDLLLYPIFLLRALFKR